MFYLFSFFLLSLVSEIAEIERIADHDFKIYLLQVDIIGKIFRIVTLNTINKIEKHMRTHVVNAEAKWENSTQLAFIIS